MPTIAYLVHDTNDAAVVRRVRMFHAGGARVRVAGFHRRYSPAAIDGAAVTDLGETADAKLAARAAAVARHLARPAVARAHVAGADVIVTRNLETLAIAVRAARPGQRVVYECLDIHRLLTARGLAGRTLRAAERWLLRRVSLIVTSSPAFDTHHFKAAQAYRGPVRIEENRVLLLGIAEPQAIARESRPVWRIGWFGMLRCRKSLAMLRALVRDGGGAIEVLIAGVPSYTEFDDFDRDVGDTPGLRFVGKYAAADLARLYGSVDFAWAIDYFEEGQNSTWLLPNRLYESLAFGAVPIAQAGVETAAWLERHRVGLVVNEPAVALATLLPAMTDAALVRLRADVAALPRDLLVATQVDCIALTSAVLGVD